MNEALKGEVSEKGQESIKGVTIDGIKARRPLARVRSKLEETVHDDQLQHITPEDVLKRKY